MKTVSEIQKQLSELNAKKESLKSAIASAHSKILENAQQSVLEVIEKSDLNINVVCERDRLYVHSAENQTTLLTVYYYVEGGRINSISLNYYSTVADSTFEFDRLVLIGQVAQVIKHNDIEYINETNSVFIQEYRTLKKELYSIDTTALNNQLADLMWEEKLRQLRNGIKFKTPILIGKIFTNNVKVVNVSKSGKTAEIQYKNSDGVNTAKVKVHLLRDVMDDYDVK